MHNGFWDPFSHMSITGGNYASPAHMDKKDVDINFICFYLLYHSGITTLTVHYSLLQHKLLCRNAHEWFRSVLC